MKSILFASMFVAHASFLFGASILNYLVFFWVSSVFAALVGINAFLRSSDPAAYAFRLFFWGLITQPIYVWFFGVPWWLPNILFSLSVAAWFVVRFRDQPELITLPRWAWYALYPAHLLILKALTFIPIFGMSPET